MKIVTLVFDWIWNLRFLEGYRTQLAKIVIVGLAAWQWASTDPMVIAAWGDLPDLPIAWVSGIMSYLAVKIPGFATAHKPV